MNQYHDFAVDMWGFGCIMACMIFQKYPFFYSKHGDDEDEQLRAIVKVLGKEDFFDYQQKYADHLYWWEGEPWYPFE